MRGRVWPGGFRFRHEVTMMCVRQKVKSNSVATDKESGRGLAQSKTLRASGATVIRARVLDCASFLALLHRTILCIKTSTAHVRVSSLMQSRRFISIRPFLFSDCHTNYQYESNLHRPHRIKNEHLAFVDHSVFRPAGLGR